MTSGLKLREWVCFPGFFRILLLFDISAQFDTPGLSLFNLLFLTVFSQFLSYVEAEIPLLRPSHSVWCFSFLFCLCILFPKLSLPVASAVRSLTLGNTPLNSKSMTYLLTEQFHLDALGAKWNVQNGISERPGESLLSSGFLTLWDWGTKARNLGVILVSGLSLIPYTHLSASF